MTATEPTTTATPAALEARTICEAFQQTASERAGQVALRAHGAPDGVSFGAYAERVRTIAAGLHGLGVRRGDTVALMMVNRPEFHLADMAAAHLGAIPFSIYNTSSAEQVAYVLGHAQSRVLICEAQFLPVVRAGAAGTAVEHVVSVDGGADHALDALPPSAGLDFDAAWRAVEPADVLTLIYTSGTTGPPKAVELTHDNAMTVIRALRTVLPTTPGGRCISYLPSAHVADRLVSHYMASIAHGTTVTCLPDLTQLAAALAEVRPTVWGGVPRVWEKLMAALQAGGVTDPASLPADARAAVRARLGLDAAEWHICGAAPIPRPVLRFFLDLGVDIQELWGMSELTAIATCNPKDAIRVGSVGTALPGIELRLLEDGELLTRGATVMRGYRGDPARTAETIDADGWLHTGDIATIDADGYVTIVDRKKELIINAAGKNMSPANIEQALKGSSALIGQAVCIGDARPYNVALLVIDPDAAAAFAAEHGCSADPAELREREDVQAEIARGVAAANEQLSRVEQIKRHTVLSVDWRPGADELTPTMKLRRKPIGEKYASEIEALYAA